MLAKNKSGWSLLEYIQIREEEIKQYPNVAGSFAIVRIKGKYLIGYNKWRNQWEFPVGGIEKGETAREAAERELFEETHQVNKTLEFRGLFKVMKPDGEIKYQAVFFGVQDEMILFERQDGDEMEEIRLWDLKEDIGYVDECDLKIVELACV